MIFAAGRGTRLGALGESCPKALIEIGGRTMLERTAKNLVAAGVDRIVVNVHHHAERIERFIATHDLGAEVFVSRESERPLETGGGLLHARELFHPGRPLLLHNVDVICEADLASLCATHERSGALATLAVQERETQRYLRFDEAGLCGREDRRTGVCADSRPARGPVRALAFSGIHACAPRLLELITERGVFPIVDVYLRLAAAGHAIRPWLVPAGQWLEIGNLSRLAEARSRLDPRPGG